MMVISLEVLETGTELFEGCLSVLLTPNRYYILPKRKQYI